jgi:hypothetical protein
MKKLSVSANLEEKIYDLKINDDRTLSKITTYFPLNLEEKEEILDATKSQEIFVDFKSIFSDNVSKEEWNKTKEQIKKKFQTELLDID